MAEQVIIEVDGVEVYNDFPTDPVTIPVTVEANSVVDIETICSGGGGGTVFLQSTITGVLTETITGTIQNI